MNNTYNRLLDLVLNDGRTDEIARSPAFVPTGVTKGGRRTEYGVPVGASTQGGASVRAAGSNTGGAPTVGFGRVVGRVNIGGRDVIKNPAPTPGGAPRDETGRVKKASNIGGRRIS